MIIRLAIALALVVVIFQAPNEVEAAVLRSNAKVKQQADVHLLIFETEVTAESGDAPANQLLHQAGAISGLQATLVGQGQKFDGFGSKYEAVLPILHTLPSDTIVVLSDARDVLLNIHSENGKVEEALQGFRDAFAAVTFQQPGAIVISAEAQCCVSALTYVQPGDYFDAHTGQRTERACSSGESDCLWNGDEFAEPWQSFMKDVALQRMGNAASVLDDIYLNAGLMVGHAGDLLRVLEAADILATEDDQAVLTDYMYRNPQDILLDYGQTMFGNKGGQASCMFQIQAQRLSHIKTDSTPLFVHSPGGFLQCHDDLAAQLGWKAVSPKTRRRLSQWRDGVQNYKNCPYGQKWVNGYCVKDCCRSNGKSYQCPANSVRIAGRDCYDDFDDCQCLSGYKKENNACVPVSGTTTTCYKCPMNSSARSCQNKGGFQCKNTMENDCTCDWGYKAVSGYCVKSWCNADFACPANKKRIPGRDCYDNIYDCQ